jgi:hypothetical protein
MIIALAVGIAFCVGAVVGWMVHKRSSDRVKEALYAVIDKQNECIEMYETRLGPDRLEVYLNN